MSDKAKLILEGKEIEMPIIKGTEGEKLSFEDCMKIIEDGPKPKKAKKK